MNQNDWINVLFAPPEPVDLPNPKGIVFDNVSFTEPAPFAFFLPPFGCGGLYAILVPDIAARPRPYRPIYFGQSAELAERVRPTHEKYVEWVAEAGSASRLYVSFCVMSGGENERMSVERKLIERYQPACNDTFNSLFRTIARRI